jgi:hypothetical protein
MKRFTIRSNKDKQETEVDFNLHPDTDLRDVLDSFTLFLKTCGYNLDGQYISTIYYDDLK